jgi:hypothetical protein
MELIEVCNLEKVVLSRLLSETAVVQRLSTALFYVFVNMLPPDTIFEFFGLAHIEAKEGVHDVVCNNINVRTIALKSHCGIGAVDEFR